jgi:hypothetical protein
MKIIKTYYDITTRAKLTDEYNDFSEGVLRITDIDTNTFHVTLLIRALNEKFHWGVYYNNNEDNTFVTEVVFPDEKDYLTFLLKS